MNFRKKILYGVLEKATHHHTNQLRFCTFFSDLARVGPPAPQLAVGAQEGPLRAGPPSVGRFWGHLPGPAYRALSAGRSPTRVPRQRLPLAAPRPPRPPEGASASRMAPGRRPGGGPVAALPPVQVGRRYPKAGPGYPKAAQPARFRAPPGRHEPARGAHGLSQPSAAPGRARGAVGGRKGKGSCFVRPGPKTAGRSGEFG